MATDSSTGGILLPVEPPVPLDDEALDSFLQQLFAGIAGIAGEWVRPRWQEEPPNIPPDGQDWAAIGVVSYEADSYPAVLHHSAGEGFDEMQRHEQIEALASFYGAAAGHYARRLRDGLYLAQNREPLLLAGMGLVTVGQVQAVPVLLKQRWLRRVDVSVLIRRAIPRNFDVLNLKSASGTLITETVTDPFNVEE